MLPSPMSLNPEITSHFGLRMTEHVALDLVQDVTTDCSVVASLCAATARAERGYPRVRTLQHVKLVPCL